MIRALSLLIVPVSAIVLAACAHGSGSGATGPLTPTSRWALQVEEGVDRIALAVHDAGLSANQQAALGALADRFARSGGQVIRIEAPAGGDPLAAEAAWQTRNALQARGVPANRIEVTAYHAPHPRAPVLAGFAMVQAHVPQCGAAWDSLSRTASNQPQSNFGCAVNANLAAQIADPRDILGPRAMTPADAGRRAVVFEAYRSGEATSAAREELVAGRLSQAVE